MCFVLGRTSLTLGCMEQSPYPEAMVHNYPCCVFGVQVEGREEVGELLGMEGKVDLVIPRGGNALVRSVMDQNQGRIPVLGHTEGVCHVYVDQHADIGKATKIGQFPGVGGWLFLPHVLCAGVDGWFLLPQWWMPSVTTLLHAMPWRHCSSTLPSSTHPPSRPSSTR